MRREGLHLLDDALSLLCEEAIFDRAAHDTRQRTIVERCPVRGARDVVAAELLIAAVARQRNGDELTRRLRHVIGRDGRRVCEGLAVFPDERGEDLEHVRLEPDLLML